MPKVHWIRRDTSALLIAAALNALLAISSRGCVAANGEIVASSESEAMIEMHEER